MKMEEKHSSVHLSIERPEKSSRGLAVMTLLLLIPKAVILIPHLIVLYALGIASFVVTVIAQFAVLFKGKYPPAMHKFLTDTIRWQVRVNAYFVGLVDNYPPYKLGE